MSDPEEAMQKENWSLENEIERLREALESIAKNTCCANCREAALVARTALRNK